MKIIKVESFTEFPGPRYISLGEGSGEEFRENYLEPIIYSQDKIYVDLDGVMGYGSSFLEEAFGGLVRQGVEPEVVLKLISNLVSNDDPSRILEIEGYVNDAIERLND